MNIKVRYLSKLGHTKDIANAIANTLNVNAISILDEPIIKEYTDILFLGGAPYANIMDPKLKEYANNLDKNMVKRVVLFTTSNWSRRTVKALKKILENKEIKVDNKYFYSHMLRIKKGTLRAKNFAKKYLEEVK